MQANWPGCSVQVQGVTLFHWEVACGITNGLAAHAGASRQSQKGIPSLGYGHVGQESAMWLPNGWQGVELLKDRCIGVPVTKENVVENGGQLVKLTWNR